MFLLKKFCLSPESKVKSISNVLIFSLIITITVLFISCSSDKEKNSSNLNTDTLVYHMEKVKKKYGNCDTVDAKCASVLLEYPVLDKTDSSRIDLLNSFMKELITNGGYEEGENSSIEELCQVFFDDYKSMSSEYPDYPLSWSLERTINIIYNTPEMISLKYHEFNFSGGAHPNYHTSLFTYDNKLQKFVNLGDIIGNKKNLKKLNKVAEKKFRQVWKLSEKEDLAEAGFWFDDNKFSLNNNFALVDSGIIFFFNSYEIGPYAIGTTEIALTNEELNSIKNAKNK